MQAHVRSISGSETNTDRQGSGRPGPSALALERERLAKNVAAGLFGGRAQPRRQFRRVPARAACAVSKGGHRPTGQTYSSAHRKAPLRRTAGPAVCELAACERGSCEGKGGGQGAKRAFSSKHLTNAEAFGPGSPGGTRSDSLSVVLGRSTLPAEACARVRVSGSEGSKKQCACQRERRQQEAKPMQTKQ
jgi:hypothetical protein